ncbi:hypothetical protein [Streptacidiphilus jiangxiensis]|uniref:DnaJ domain-containing protein n=1 Tax=Streptacidiphilus jiangxiensis TaxID=235985 RepID=A0A1H7JFS0_STRJI|nr:hypothetical protein [Streptacidiphilus jiangxiensis]SEK73316.1 hypothetical protein SAMN05414137_103268 [Streptacidiphilus jiangxiensis]
MTTDRVGEPLPPARWTDPEEAELEARLVEAEAEWVDAEVGVETLRVELDNFALVHHQRLGPMYVRLDELDALIAEARAARTGSAEDLRRAYEARSVLDPMPDLASFFGEAEASGEVPTISIEAPERIRPDREAQRLYRDLARRAHPDLAQDPEEVGRRSEFIARVNEAYARGDVLALEQLAQEWADGDGASAHPQAGTPERVAWLRQRLDWLESRMRRLESARAELADSPMGQLLMLHPDDPDALLEVLAEQLLASVAERQAELETLLS